jgi:hypothetical protein
VSFAGSGEGFVGINAHADFAQYFTLGTVFQGFASFRSDSARGFFEAQATYSLIKVDTVEDGDVSTGGNTFSLGTLQVGAGAPISPQTAFVVEAGATKSFEGDDDLVLTADLGVRGKLGEKGASWMAKAGLFHVDELTSFGAAFELRTDLI